MSPIREAAMEAGWIARLAGSPATANPHEVPATASVRRLRLIHRLRVSWSRGWAAADRLLAMRRGRGRRRPPRRLPYLRLPHRVSGGARVEAPPAIGLPEAS